MLDIGKLSYSDSRYGPEHPAMTKKLSQMNGVLERVFDIVDDKTLVVVMGDHGMDPKGDHGGDSENELSAGLYLYAKKPLTLNDSTWEKLYAKLDSVDFDSDEPLVSLNSERTFPQIDINPTIALLAGLPIPFGNLGSIIPELFYYSKKNSSIEALENLVRQSRLNAHQIQSYISEYSMVRSWASDAMTDLDKHFKSAEILYAGLRNSENYEDNLMNLYLDYIIYSRKALTSARKIWARFDVPLIIMGILILILAGIIFTSSFALNLSLAKVLNEQRRKILLSGFVCSFAGGSQSFRQFMSSSLQEDAAQSWYHQASFLGVLGSLFAIFFYLIRDSGTRWKFNLPSQSPNSISILSSVLCLMYIITPASDSFTVYEDSSTLYLLQTFGLFNILYSLSLKQVLNRDKIILHT
jgi:phosphatidylinositol glycan class O